MTGHWSVEIVTTLGNEGAESGVQSIDFMATNRVPIWQKSYRATDALQDVPRSCSAMQASCQCYAARLSADPCHTRSLHVLDVEEGCIEFNS
jgi:hypothetical protein